MVDELGPDTNEKMRALCKKISVAHDLDAEIQEELYSHMEDKLLAYLSGEEALAEEDAFILVREHFGDPAALKSLLQDVHVVGTHVSFARRLAAITAVYLVYMSAISLVLALVSSLTAWLQYTGGEPRSTRLFYSAVVSTTLLVATLIYWRVLLDWERRIRAGGKPWFQRWRGTSIAALLGTLVCIESLIPVSEGAYDRAMMPLPAPAVVNWLCGGIIVISVVWHAIIWLWWCDRPPRLPRTIIYAALAWLVLALFPWQFLHIVQLEMYSYDPVQNNPGDFGQVILGQEHEDEIAGIWVLRAGRTENQTRPQDVVTSLLACIFIIALAKFIYIRLNHRRRPPDEDYPETTA